MQQAFAAVWRNAYVRTLVTLLLFLAAFLFLWRTRQVWFLAVAAFLIAYLVYPLLVWSQRRFHARWLGLVLFFLALGVLVALMVSLVVGLVQQVIQFSQTVPALVQRGHHRRDEFADHDSQSAAARLFALSRRERLPLGG